MSTLKFGEQEAGEELLSAALYVEEGQDGDEGAPQDGMAYLRCPALIITLIITSTQGCIFFPKIEFFYKSLFGGVEFFMVRNGNFGPNLVVFEQKI